MKQLVITGMHRSGTSLLANAAERAGIAMGDQILASGKGNLPGHFEDVEFVRFHEHLLESRGWSALFPPDQALVASPAERQTARSLAEARAAKPLWGFKDPRAALVLDLWADVLDDPFFLLVYRHPIEVVLSLLRRGIDLDVQSDPGSALRAWTIYNRRVVEFRRAHPERCLLWNVYGAIPSLATALRTLGQRMGSALAVEPAAETFQERHLRGGLAAADIRWEAWLPEVFGLYGELQKTADLPDTRDLLGRAGAPAGSPDRDLAEVAEHLLAIVLAAPSVPARASATERVAYSDLRQLNFQHQQQSESLAATVEAQAVTIQELRAALEGMAVTARTIEATVRELEAAVQTRGANLQRLEAERGALERDLEKAQAELSAAGASDLLHAQELARVGSRLASSEATLERLAQERRELEREQLILGQTKGWRLLQGYWALTNRLRGRQPPTRRSRGGASAG